MEMLGFLANRQGLKLLTLQVVLFPSRAPGLHPQLLGHRVRPRGAQRQQGRRPPHRRHRRLPGQLQGARLGL